MVKDRRSKYVTKYTTNTDPVEFPRRERAGIVVPDAYLVRPADVHRLDLELVLLSGLEVVTAVIQPDLVRLDRLAVLVLAVDDQVNVGVSTSSSLVSGVHHAQPRHHWHTTSSLLYYTAAQTVRPRSYYVHVTVRIKIHRNTTSEKALRETQTLRAGCSKA